MEAAARGLVSEDRRPGLERRGRGREQLERSCGVMQALLCTKCDYRGLEVRRTAPNLYVRNAAGSNGDVVQ